MSNTSTKRSRSTSAAVAAADAPESSTASKRPRSALATKEEALMAEEDYEKRSEEEEGEAGAEASTSRRRSVTSHSPPLPRKTTTTATSKVARMTTKSKVASTSSSKAKQGEDKVKSVEKQSMDVDKYSAASPKLQLQPRAPPKGAREAQLLFDDYADLEARCREVQDNFDALQREHERVLALRETEAEAALRELAAANANRTEALRKQISTYAKEGDELRQQLDTLQEERRELLRDKRARERQNGTEGGDTSRVDQSESENEKDENANNTTGGNDVSPVFKSSRAARKSSRPKKVPGPAIEDLQEENNEMQALNEALQEEIRQLKLEMQEQRKDMRTMKHEWQMERAASETSLKDTFEKQKKALVRENEELAVRNQELAKELAFEIEQSKKLQSQAHHHKESSVPPPKATAKVTAIAGDEELKQLLLDLTGLTLVRRPTEAENSYNFLMSDYRKRKTLNFKLHVDREAGQVDFIPDLLPGRDDEVIDNMEPAIRGHIKFEYEMMQTFFKRLWRALNGHK